jgi:hypothetical protein
VDVPLLDRPDGCNRRHRQVPLASVASPPEGAAPKVGMARRAVRVLWLRRPYPTKKGTVLPSPWLILNSGKM